MAAIWATHQPHFRHQDEDSANSTYLAKSDFYQAEHVNWIQTQHLPPIYSHLFTVSCSELKKMSIATNYQTGFFYRFCHHAAILQYFYTFFHADLQSISRYQSALCTCMHQSEDVEKLNSLG